MLLRSGWRLLRGEGAQSMRVHMLPFVPLALPTSVVDQDLPTTQSVALADHLRDAPDLAHVEGLEERAHRPARWHGLGAHAAAVNGGGGSRGSRFGFDG
jgi:hypothetical protein